MRYLYFIDLNTNKILVKGFNILGYINKDFFNYKSIVFDIVYSIELYNKLKLFPISENIAKYLLNFK
jgi:hypothetical protein